MKNGELFVHLILERSLMIKPFSTINPADYDIVRVEAIRFDRHTAWTSQMDTNYDGSSQGCHHYE